MSRMEVLRHWGDTHWHRRPVVTISGRVVICERGDVRPGIKSEINGDNELFYLKTKRFTLVDTVAEE